MAIYSLLATGLVLVAAGPGVANLTDNLAAYYHLDGNGNDSSGNGLNLTIVGGAGFAPGLLGRALNLSGNANQYAQMSAGVDDSALNFGSGNFTIQAWVNFTRISDQTLVEKFSGADGPGWTLTGPGGDTFQFYAEPTVVLNYTPSGGISTRVWHDVTALRSGHIFEMFVDGTLVAAAFGSGAITSSPNPLLIGRRDAQDPNGSYPVDGQLDEIAIWTRALSDAELTILYNDGNGMLLGTPLATAWTTSGASGSWDIPGNWAGSLVPNGVGQQAVFKLPRPIPALITLDSRQTVGMLTLGNSAGYILAPGNSGSLTLDNSGGTGGGQIIVSSGTHSITAPTIIANTNAAVTLNAHGRLTVSGNVSESGGRRSLTISGDGSGMLVLSGSDTYSGGTTVEAGTLVVTNSEALRDGSSLTVGNASLFPSNAPIVPAASASPVPEPCTLTLLAVLLGAVQVYRRVSRSS